MARAITSFKCLTFDCYGTLIDWETGIFHALQPLVERLPAAHPLKNDRPALLRAFTRHEGLVQAAQPAALYSDVLASAYGALAAELGLPSAAAADAHAEPGPHPIRPRPVTDQEKTDFGLSVGDWPVFSDTIAAMKRLHRHFTLVVLSNVDHASFRRSREQQLLDTPLDAICLAEDIGSYKPDLRNFHFVMDRCAERGFRKDEILHTAQSLKHDHEPAKQVGLTSAWIARGTRTGREGQGGSSSNTDDCESVMGGDEAAFAGRVDISWRFGSLEEMADYVDAEAARLAQSS
ncbi:hypothetical protein ESCO_001256 [Escovopsis weberi]|uniref:Uncharacterized protein n=1 Tax=Escovopsis weberi TaxID=150374 RepID=A0A0M8MU65_ESCWE|nr:hypothetical protein ESCO_001256 [Escovopsis weberi]